MEIYEIKKRILLLTSRADRLNEKKIYIEKISTHRKK